MHVIRRLHLATDVNLVVNDPHVVFHVPCVDGHDTIDTVKADAHRLPDDIRDILEISVQIDHADLPREVGLTRATLIQFFLLDSSQVADHPEAPVQPFQKLSVFPSLMVDNLTSNAILPQLKSEPVLIREQQCAPLVIIMQQSLHTARCLRHLPVLLQPAVKVFFLIHIIDRFRPLESLNLK